jgi:hypothetical protein
MFQQISCKTRTNIRQLVNLIFETVWGLKTSNGKTLLEQKIPSKYIHLEEIIAYLANERKSQGWRDSVNDISLSYGLFECAASIYVYRRICIPMLYKSRNRLQIKTKCNMPMLLLDHFMPFPIVHLFLV